MDIPFFSAAPSASTGVGTALGILKILFYSLAIAVPFGAIAFLIVLLLQERLRVVVTGVQGKIMNLRVIKRGGMRFIRYRGSPDLQPYPPDNCLLPYKRKMPMCVVRQVGDDYIPYNIRDMKMNLGDNRLMRQQYAQNHRDINAKYDTSNWMQKAAPYFAFALFGVMTVLFLIIGHKTICG